MAVKLSFAGITLPLVTPKLEREWLARVHPRDVFRGFDGWNFNVGTQSLPTPPIPTPPAFRFGVLHWPTGACRPAWFHAVVNRDKLDEIRTAVSDPGTPQSLVLNDGRTGKTVTASMYLLPARPLNQLGHTKSDGWVLTLTDQRFFWYLRRGVVTQPSSWSDLYSQIGTLLGTTITPAAVNSAYGVPSAKWISQYLSLPPILDAVAATVGQRVVVSLSGSVTTVGATAASAAFQTYLAAADPELSGGEVAAADIARYSPASVKVLFLDQSTIPYPAAPHVETKTLASLAPAGYSGSTGMSGFAQVVNADTPYTGSNTTAVGDYATQAATDWYNWRLASPDIVWPGVEPYTPTGWEDIVEWTFQKRDTGPFASTTLARAPWNDFPSGDWRAGQETEPSSPQESGCGAGCGWFSGMATGWCLTGTVIADDGSCQGIASLNASGFLLRYATGEMKWVSQVWSAAATSWVDFDFNHHTGSGPLKVWISKFDPDAPELAASIDGTGLLRSCCGDFTANFALGNQLGPYCTGTVPAEPCSPNSVVVKISCVCCPIDGYTTAGYYVVQDGDSCVVIPVDDENKCDTSIVIYFGPFATLELAEAAAEQCQGGGVDTTCCPDDPIPETLTAVITGGTCPDTYELVYNGVLVSPGWAAELCPMAGPQGTLSCVAGVWGWDDGAGGSMSPPTSFDCETKTWTFNGVTGGSLGTYNIVITG